MRGLGLQLCGSENTMKQVMSGHDWDVSKHLGGAQTRHRCLEARGVGNVHAAQYSQSTKTDGRWKAGCKTSAEGKG